MAATGLILANGFRGRQGSALPTLGGGSGFGAGFGLPAGTQPVTPVCGTRPLLRPAGAQPASASSSGSASSDSTMERSSLVSSRAS